MSEPTSDDVVSAMYNLLQQEEFERTVAEITEAMRARYTSEGFFRSIIAPVEVTDADLIGPGVVYNEE